MREKLRKTAIDIIGDIPWGTHFCLFYEGKQDLVDILVPYFKAGLENNEFCMWVTSQPLTIEDAKRALKGVVRNLDDYIKSGQIEILDYSQWYTKSGMFEADKVLQGWLEKHDKAVKRGFDGLRLTGNTFWLKKRDWKDFVDYEAAVNSVIRKYRMLAICTYSLDKCGAPEIMDVVCNHQFALIKRVGKWEILESAEQKKAEEALRESENRYRTSIELTQQLSWTTNSNGNVVEDIPTWRKFTGQSYEETKGTGWAKALHPDDVERAIRVWKKAIETKSAYETEYRVRRSDGVYRYFLTRGVPLLKKEDGNIKEWVSVCVDITDRKKAEEALRESEEKYRTLFERTRDAIFVADSETGIITDCNRAASEMVQREKSELVGKHQRILHPPQEAEGEFSASFKQHRAEKEGQVVETQAITKKGEIRDVEIRANRIEFKGRKLFYAIFRDITERKKTEEAVERLNRDLQATVKELTQSNNELQEFVHVASHDLKTPLRAIGILADWILTDYKDKFDEPGQERLKLLVGRAKRIDELINSLLQYSRVGHTRGKDKEVDLNVVLSEVIREIAPPENIEITVQNELPTVIGEQRRMAQIFQNLLNNAIKYIEKPRGEIKVGCVEKDGFWKFSICDNGCGIEQKYFGKIFRVFQKLASQDETEGTGIGLAIVRRIVELYGGRVWVESKPEEGSTFFFTLPKQEMGVKNAKLEACIVG